MIASSDTSSGLNFLHYDQQSLSKFHFSLETVDIESPQIGHEWKQFYLVTKTTEFIRLLNIFKKGGDIYTIKIQRLIALVTTFISFL